MNIVSEEDLRILVVDDKVQMPNLRLSGDNAAMLIDYIKAQTGSQCVRSR